MPELQPVGEKFERKESNMLIIDRFEGDFAVVETEKGTALIPRQDTPAEAKEGDVLKLSVDVDGTTKRRQLIAERMTRLLAK